MREITDLVFRCLTQPAIGVEGCLTDLIVRDDAGCHDWHALLLTELSRGIAILGVILLVYISRGQSDRVQIYGAVLHTGSLFIDGARSFDLKLMRSEERRVGNG